MRAWNQAPRAALVRALPLARAALALALAAGCSSAQSGSTDAADGRQDVKADTADAEARPDVVPDEGTGDLATDRDAADAKPDADGPAAETSAAKDGGGAEGPTDVGVEADVGETATCKLAAPPLTLPSTVTGTLGGAGHNPLVSCNGLTTSPGPDATFELELTASTVIELDVRSRAETAIAVRPACASENMEIACARGPLDDASPSSGFDGGLGDPFDASGAGGAGGPTADAGTGADPLALTTTLRTRLAAGSYVVIVDTFGEGILEPFTLEAHAVPAAGNASCAAPTVVPSQTTVRGQLDVAAAPTTGCSGSAASALYYAVGVPAGQRLTARVQPLGGDHAWMPRLEALATCGPGACLAQGHAAAGATQQLDWTNNGSNWRLVTLAVSADSAVRGAQFDLSVSVTDLLATCSRPTPLGDGAALFAQDIGIAPAPGGQTCGVFNDRAYYYSATLLPQQQLTVLAVGTASQSPFASPVTIALRSSCDASACLPVDGDGGPFINTSDKPVTVIIEATPSGNTFDTRFDLRVSMPPPPADIKVTPQSGLTTSEAGKTATFSVVLASPPTKPVSIGLTSDTPGEGTVSPASVSFDDKTWNQPQTVTVTGVDDHASDGPRRYKVVTSAATSADLRYAGMNPPDVLVTNLDDDPGLFIEGGESLVTSEAGTTATFTVRLNGKPSSSVRVPLSSSDVGEGSVSPAELTFQPASWDAPQTVTVKGVDDADTDGTQPYTVVIGPLVSDDATYGGLDPADLSAHNRDDDLAPVGVKLLAIANCNAVGHDDMAVDTFGTLYVALFCDGQLQVLTSTDGGTTFGAPVVIPGSTDLGGDFMIAAGGGGVAYLVYEASGLGLMFTRSTDWGQTWSARKLLTVDGGAVRLSTSGDVVAVVAASPTFRGGLFLRSLDGGVTFGPTQLIDGTNLAVAISPDRQTFWLADLSFGGKLRRSTDGGLTFTNGGQVDLSFGPFAFGARNAYVGLGTAIRVYPLDDASMFQDIQNTGLSGQSFTLAVDDAETVTVLNLSSDGNRTEAVRVASGGAPTAAKVVGPRADVAWAVPLSRKAVAFLLHTGGLPLFAVTTW